MKLFQKSSGVILYLVLAGVGTLHLRVGYLVNQPVPAARPADVGAADQYYFAYGANMSTRYLYNVRGVLPAHSAPGVINGFEVRFMPPGITALEPAFAYLLKAEAQKTHGVLHRVSKQDLNRVKESEGTGYEWVTLPVEVGTGQIVSAQTLVRLSHGEGAIPSRRYLAILIEGATEHGLPAAYVAELEEITPAYVPVASELLGNILQAVVMKRSGKCASLIIC